MAMLAATTAGKSGRDSASPNMTLQELKSGRERYGYIPARLLRVDDGIAGDITWGPLTLKKDLPLNWQSGGSAIRSKYSSLALDSFHQTLLNSENDAGLIHGLLSVVFGASCPASTDVYMRTEPYRDAARFCMEDGIPSLRSPKRL
jgi:hypothetical protein